MYIKNRRKSNIIKGFGSYQTMCLNEQLKNEWTKKNPDLQD